MVSQIVLATLTTLACHGDIVPKVSADVVYDIKFNPGSLADNLEMYYFTFKIKDGWTIYVSPNDGKPTGKMMNVVDFYADGKSTPSCGIYYGKGKPYQNSKGNKYYGDRLIGGLYCHLIYTSVMNSNVVSVKVRVVATNGKSDLPASILVGEYEPKSPNQ